MYRRAAPVLPSRCVKDHQYTLLYNVSSRTLNLLRKFCRAAELKVLVLVLWHAALKVLNWGVIPPDRVLKIPNWKVLLSDPITKLLNWGGVTPPIPRRGIGYRRYPIGQLRCPICEVNLEKVINMHQ